MTTYNHPLSEQVESAVKLLTHELHHSQKDSGFWEGELASSALSTATAVSSMSVLREGVVCFKTQQHIAPKLKPASDQLTIIDHLIERGCKYIVDQQRSDGGWGDTDRSNSNISTTLLCIAALKLAGRANQCARQIELAWKYVDQLGRWEGLTKRYGKDKTFAVPILTNCALAGLVDWKDVPALPYEAAALPQSLYRFIQLPVVSYAIPALVAIGQVREHFVALRNPLRWPIRKLAIGPSLNVLLRMQPASGGYLEAIPLTSFVLMSLAAKGLADHPVSKNALRFLMDSVREDGSWPIDTNLATWVTSLATSACLMSSESNQDSESTVKSSTIEWLLSCQHREKHPFTGASPGGWGWSNLSGAVPDADDTPCALIALHKWRVASSNDSRIKGKDEAISTSVQLGVRWLLDLQNRDGGWPTFCRGWGTLPFDRSGSDLTAHAIRALHHWSTAQSQGDFDWVRSDMQAEKLLKRIKTSIERGWRYLEKHQNEDGSWLPLWFGNQDELEESNPVYGTARVLIAYAECNQQDLIAAKNGIAFLKSKQNADGGWGGGSSVFYDGSAEEQSSSIISTIEETAQAIEALVACGCENSPQITRAVEWLCNAIESRSYAQPQPIGFYFAKLWYYEKMYPIVYSLAALGRLRKHL